MKNPRYSRSRVEFVDKVAKNAIMCPDPLAFCSGMVYIGCSELLRYLTSNIF